MKGPTPISSTLRDRIDVAVVGAGVSGLAAASLLHAAGKRVCVLEAANEIGGRIRSFYHPDNGRVLGDRGPTWVWPAYQPIVARWLDRLGLETMDQFEEGQAVVEMNPGAPPMKTFLPGQHGSMRVVGGTKRLIEALAGSLPEEAIRTRVPVRRLTQDDGGVTVHFEASEMAPVQADTVVVAVPPRIAAAALEYEPALPPELARALAATPTWMAPHAKAVVVYDQPFWRTQGLSGRIASRVGPMIEAHDHSSADGKVAALFGFLGWPHDVRAQHADVLTSEIIAQLMRCFGPDAASPAHVFVEDWAQNARITQPADLAGPGAHPDVGPNVLRQPIADGRIVFAAAETAEQSPGIIEGALVSAERVARQILERTATG